MKKIFVVLLIVLVLASCGETKLTTKQTKFVVERIDSGDGVSYYKLLPIDTENLNVSRTWICDSIGKFCTGDTLVFTKISK